ncbi:MAG: hypothetical protein ACF8XB_24045 [Planctomycetota bacterium JB042]
MTTPLRLFVGLALLAGTLPFALAADGRGRLEIALVLALAALLALVVLPRIGFGAWTRGERAVVTALLGASLLGHVVGDARATFPFVRWEMYGARPDSTASIDALELRATVGGVDRRVSLRELYGESGFRVEAALRNARVRPERLAAALDAIARRLAARTGESVIDLRLAAAGNAGQDR